ncbi:hypothetical protein QUF72_21650 [Desulfobacterales bacterium HSG2]|nr:hypothetical protein [Desulfobacterales bacterium HSG2]
MRHLQIREILRERLGEEHAELLTVPVITRESLNGDQEALWLSTYLRDPKPYPSLSDEERGRVNEQLAQLLGDIEVLSEELRKSEDEELSRIGEIMARAVLVPGPDCVYADAENISLVCWGFTSDKVRETEFSLSEMIRSRLAPDENSEEGEDTVCTPKNEPLSTKIRIKVADKENRPAANLRVTASYQEASAESDTDQDGRVNFPKVPIPSHVNIRIAFPDREPFEKNIICEKEDEEHLIDLPFTFRQKALMRFQIVDSESRGLKKIPLCLEWKRNQLEDITDAEGRSEFTDIPVGEKVTLHVKHSKKEPLAKNFRCCQKEELHQIVVDIPKKDYKILWIFLCVFALSGLGILAWQLTKSGPSSPEQPGVIPSDPSKTVAGESPSLEKKCRCNEEIEALWQEIRRLRKEMEARTVHQELPERMYP